MNVKFYLLKHILIIYLMLLVTNIFAQNLLNNPEGVVYDLSNNSYLISNYGDGKIIRIDSLGQQSIFNEDCNSLAGMHLVGDTLFALDYQGDHPGLVALSLSTADTLFTLYIEGMNYLNDIISDSSGNLYITDSFANKIFKVRMEDLNYSVFVDSGLNTPDGIMFDEENNRLLVNNSVQSSNGPIESVNLNDSTMTTLIETGIMGLDGITTDDQGYTYISSWDSDTVYRYDENFSQPPEVIADGYTAPGDIYFNSEDNILVVPDFFTNSVDFIEIVYTEIKENIIAPDNNILLTNYPNPFNPSTTVSFELNLDITDGTEILIYNLKGQKIRQYSISNDQSSIVWDGTDSNNQQVASGIYFYKLKIGTYVYTKKMMLLD